MDNDFVNKKLEKTRDLITNKTLVVLSIAGIFGQIVATLRILYTSWSAVFIIQWIILLILIATTLFRKKLSLIIKVAVLLFLSYGMMFTGVFKFGLLASSKLYIFLIPLFSYFVLKSNKSIWIFVFTIITFLGIGLLFSFNILVYDINTQEYAENFNSWILFAIGISVITGLVFYLVKTLNKALVTDIIDLTASYSTLLEKDNELSAKNKQYIKLNNELKAKNIEISNINIEVEEARKKAEEGEQLKTSFLKNLSHEIRTPMNGIIGFSEFLQANELSEEKRKEYAKIISQSSKKLLRMVNDVMDISKLETKQWSIDYSEFNLNSALEKLYQSFEQDAKIQSIEFKLKADFLNHEAIIVSDKDKLLQVLGNLLANSLKFTNKGHVLFGYKLEENVLQFYVLDTGIGISRSNQHCVFDAFKQADKTITDEYGGAGLGLAISKGIVNLMGGDIWFESGHGNGTIFYFTIPYKKPKKNIKTNNIVDESILRGKSILVVDDEPINFAFLKTLLVNVGAKAYYASNGQDAVDFCKVNKYLDLVLMDIKMPIMNGIDAAIQIKLFWPDLPIIAQTAYASDDDRHKAMRNGFNDFITKPIKKQELLRKVLQLI